jgi:hypothetical protein
LNDPYGARKRKWLDGTELAIAVSVSASSWTTIAAPVGSTWLTRSRWVTVWFATKCPSATSCARIAAAPGITVMPFGLGSVVVARCPPFTKNVALMFCDLRYVESSAVRALGPSSNVSASAFAGRLVPVRLVAWRAFSARPVSSWSSSSSPSVAHAPTAWAAERNPPRASTEPRRIVREPCRERMMCSGVHPSCRASKACYSK